MKRTFSFIFSIIILLCTLCPANLISFAANQITDIEATQLGSTDTYYSFDAQTKTLTISGTGSTPDFSNNNVSQPWYLWRSDGSIEHVIVEEGITSIGSYFFYYVSALDFELPSTLSDIGNYAMSGINYTESIVLPEGVTTIGNYAFYFSASLRSINIPSTVVSIGTSAFENCLSLEEVDFADMYSDISVGKRAFFYCSSLKSVCVPKRATLLSYSFGFYSASKGSAYSDFVLNVYRDSPAYNNYCGSGNYLINPDNYNIINEFVMHEGQTVACTYYSDSYKEEMIFIFTPDVSDNYKFYSSGSVDVDCSLKDEAGNTLVSHEDNSPDDLNFTVSCYLEADATYYYYVNCVSEMSVGDFTVCLINSHSYEYIVIPPDLTESGYTAYTCRYCGDSYNADFVNRTGVRVTGRVVLMEAPDGSHSHNLSIVNANITVDGNALTLTDNRGEFEFYVLPAAEKLCISTEFSIDRVFDITCDENMEMCLGDISLFNCDYTADGYVNAKDFAAFRKLYCAYSQEDEALYISIDYNQDGVIDYDDFRYAENFFAYGKITESIYN